jgi:hypothetical protein
MNAHYRLKIFSTLLIVAALSGCAGKAAFKGASKAEMSRDYETAMNEYKKALDSDPSNTNTG